MKHHPLKTLQQVALLLVASAVLTACGGGKSDDGTPITAVNATAVDAAAAAEKARLEAEAAAKAKAEAEAKAAAEAAEKARLEAEAAAKAKFAASLAGVTAQANTTQLTLGEKILLWIKDGFDGIKAVLWDFGDGVKQSIATAGDWLSGAFGTEHTYAAPGDYTVTATLQDATGTALATRTVDGIKVVPSNKPPVASFAVSDPSPVFQWHEFTFDPAASQDSDGSLVQWVWDFGDGSSPVSASSADPVKHQYGSVGSYTIKLTVVDNSGSSAQTTAMVQVVASKTPLPTGITDQQCYQAGSNALVPCSSPAAIALSGAGKQDGMLGGALSYSALPGYSKEECVKDNATGLIWEGKTASGLRAGSNTYTNYGDGRSGDASAYVAAVNAQGLCGFNDWRLPTVDELQGIVDYSKDSPAVDTTWFTNTPGTYTWASSPYAGGSYLAWTVYFDYGYVGNLNRNDGYAVRLVRASQ